MLRLRREAVSRATEEIRSYLREHPEATDNLLGIVTCWLRHDASFSNLAGVEAALAQLVEEHVVESRTMPDGGVLYRVGASARKR
jgi:hypothetical protein